MKKYYIPLFGILFVLIGLPVMAQQDSVILRQGRNSASSTLRVSKGQQLLIDSIDNKLLQTIAGIGITVTSEERKQLIEKAVSEQLKAIKQVLNTQQYISYMAVREANERLDHQRMSERERMLRLKQTNH